MSDALVDRAGRAFGWNLASTLATRFSTLAIGVALARILGPHEFGTFAVALVALLAMLSFNELGVSLAIVRWPEPPGRIAPTVATISTLTSLLLCIASVILAPWFCAAMDAPDATGAVRMLAVTLVISGVVATPAALMQREFRARRRMVIDQAATWTGAVVSITTALAGMGAMSLAVGRLAGALISGVLFVGSAPVPFGFDRAVARRLIKFGLPLAGASIIVFGTTYVDHLIVGSVLGPAALGFYVLAFNLSSWPLNVLSQPVRQVLPAAFARLQHNTDALRGAFTSSVGMLAAVTLPICLVLAGAAEPLISVVYGSQWAPAADALIWLGLFVAARILFELIYDYFVVLATTRVLFVVQVLWLVALVPSVYAGAKLGGIGGAAIAQLAVALLVVLPLYVYALGRVGISVRALGARLLSASALGAAVASLTVAAQRLTSFDIVVLFVGGVSVLLALSLQMRQMRITLAQLRTLSAAGSA